MDVRHELVMPNSDLPFRLFLFEGKDGNYKVIRHWHRSVEIFLVLEGRIDFYINARHFELHGGDFVIVNPNEIHSIDSPKPNRTVVIQIPWAEFEAYAGESYMTFSEQTVDGNVELVNLVADMFQTYEDKRYGYELKVKGQFFLLLHLLLTKFRSGEPEDEGVLKQKYHLDKLSDITNYMRRNYDQQITLESVAKEFGFSPTYLSRIFQRYAKVNFKTYLLDLRVEYGRKELLETDFSLSDIAEHSGFSESRTFARAFESRYGCLPSIYRKRVRKYREETSEKGQEMDIT